MFEGKEQARSLPIIDMFKIARFFSHRWTRHPPVLRGVVDSVARIDTVCK